VPGAAGSHARRRIPPRFWLYAAAALLYGIVETMSGNWGQLQITGGLHGTAAQASLALAAFWAMATLGRVLFAVLQRRVPARWIYRMIPLVVAVAYLVVLLGAGAGAGAGSGAGAGAAGAAAAGSAGGSVVLGIVAFGLAGLGCSALLPFTLSFAEEQLSSNNSITGGLIATSQAGYGVAAFGVGPLLSGGVSLAAVFGAAGVVAVVLCGVAFVLTSRRFTHSSS
jgi:fucose permease